MATINTVSINRATSLGLFISISRNTVIVIVLPPDGCLLSEILDVFPLGLRMELAAVVDSVLVVEAIRPSAPGPLHGPFLRSVDVDLCRPGARIVDRIDADPFAVNA